MKETAAEKQIKIYKKMSAEKKIGLLDDFYQFAKVLKDDDQTISNKNKRDSRRA